MRPRRRKHVVVYGAPRRALAEQPFQHSPHLVDRQRAGCGFLRKFIRLAAETQFFVGASASRCLLGQLICRASRSTSDQGRACGLKLWSIAAVHYDAYEFFGKRCHKIHIPVLPDSLDRGEFLKKTFGYLKEAVGRYCGKRQDT